MIVRLERSKVSIESLQFTRYEKREPDNWQEQTARAYRLATRVLVCHFPQSAKAWFVVVASRGIWSRAKLDAGYLYRCVFDDATDIPPVARSVAWQPPTNHFCYCNMDDLDRNRVRRYSAYLQPINQKRIEIGLVWRFARKVVV